MGKLNKDIEFIIHPNQDYQPSNWQNILSLIRHHRYYHVLEDIFKNHGDEISIAVKDELKNDYKRQLQDQLLIASELQKICSILNERKLFYINLKGTVLALQLYGKISDRLTRDIDFLIRENDIDLFMDFFHGLGYRLVKAEKDRPERSFRRIKKNYTLIHSETRLIVELHWDLFSNPYFYTYQSTFCENPDSEKLNGTLITTLNRENNFLYLCMHGIYHEFFRLFWLRDVAHMVRNNKLDWNGILNRARKEGIDRIILAAVILAREVYKFETPYEDCRQDPDIRRIVNHNINVINRSSLPAMRDRLKRIRYFMQLRRDPRYKLECLLGVGKRYWVRR